MRLYRRRHGAHEDAADSAHGSGQGTTTTDGDDPHILQNGIAVTPSATALESNLFVFVVDGGSRSYYHLWNGSAWSGSVGIGGVPITNTFHNRHNPPRIQRNAG